MLRRPVFWIVFIAFSLAAAIFTFKNFSTAFPLVSVWTAPSGKEKEGAITGSASAERLPQRRQNISPASIELPHTAQALITLPCLVTK